MTCKQSSSKHRRPPDRVTALDEALEWYIHDKFASSSAASRMSHDLTRVECHKKASLTVRSLMAVFFCYSFMAHEARLAATVPFERRSSIFEEFFVWMQHLDQKAKEEARSVKHVPVSLQWILRELAVFPVVLRLLLFCQCSCRTW